MIQAGTNHQEAEKTMIVNRENVRQQLMETDMIFRKMVEDHRSLDLLSTTLSSTVYMTQTEKSKLKQIKRRKLLLRDRIEQRILQAAREETQ